MIGRIVISSAGRDKGKYMVVIKEQDNALLVCDGKERRIENPKLKNIKHIKITEDRLQNQHYSSNRRLRTALYEYRKGAVTPKEET